MQGGKIPESTGEGKEVKEAFSKQAFAEDDGAQPCGSLENLHGTPSAFSQEGRGLGVFLLRALLRCNSYAKEFSHLKSGPH